jgi:hypothetical protein
MRSWVRGGEGDEVSRYLILAWIIEPTSKLGSVRVLEEADIVSASYPMVFRRLRAYARGLLVGQLSVV